MCRWLAYSGPRMRISELLFDPVNSLIRQSLSAQRGTVPTNGDGFGLGWYGERTKPGLFRDTLPAWNDANLRDLAQQIAAPLFFAHVRASTGTATSRDNCHPFRLRNLLFMHNGEIGQFVRIRRDIEYLIKPEYYAQRHGTTDSEAFFLLALGNGLEESPVEALAATVDQIEDIMDAADIAAPFRMTAAFSDGDGLVALRHSNDHKSPTLYYAVADHIDVEDGEITFRLPYVSSRQRPRPRRGAGAFGAARRGGPAVAGSPRRPLPDRPRRGDRGETVYRGLATRPELGCPYDLGATVNFTARPWESSPVPLTWTLGFVLAG